MSKPKLYIGLTGTNTEVGKTYVGSNILSGLRDKSITVAARKEAQSFDPNLDEPLDSVVLSKATGEDHRLVCPKDLSFALPLAPFMAKRELIGTDLKLDELSNISFQDGIQVGIIEGAGGILSPLCADGDFIDLMYLQKVDVVLCVAEATLGSLNSILSCYYGFRDQMNSRGYTSLENIDFLIYLNKFESENRTNELNYLWLRQNTDFKVFTKISEIVQHLTQLIKFIN